MKTQSRPVVIASALVVADLQIGPPNKTRNQHSYAHAPVCFVELEKTARTGQTAISTNTTPFSRR